MHAGETAVCMTAGKSLNVSLLITVCAASNIRDGTTRPNFYQPFSRIALVYQLFCSRKIADRLLYDWIAEKNLVEKATQTVIR